MQTLKQPQKAYWKNRSYHRHSVERDVEKFMGWQTLTKILQLAEQVKTNLPKKMFPRLIATTFAGAFRINECLLLKKENFNVKPKSIEVIDAPLSKRFRKKDVKIFCRRCEILNEKFEVVCQKCGANLIMGGGRKKYVTEKLDIKRVVFEFPIREMTSDYVLELLENNDSPYLFENPYTRAPVTASWALWHLNGKRNHDNLSNKIGIDLWNHRFRSERLTFLGMRREIGGYGLTRDELKTFSGIVEEKTLDRYAKSKENYIQKMGL